MSHRFLSSAQRNSLLGLLAISLAVAGCGQNQPEGGNATPTPQTAKTIRIGTGVTPETKHAAYLYAAALEQGGYSVDIVDTAGSRDELFESMGVESTSFATADPTATSPADRYVHIVPDLSGDLLLYLTDNGETSPTTIEEERASAQDTAKASAGAEDPTPDPQETTAAAMPTPSLSPTPTGAALNVRGLSSNDIVSYMDRSLPDTITTLNPSAATTRYGYAITTATAQKYGIKTMDDLGEQCKHLTFTAPADFADNPAGVDSLAQHYSCTPGKILDNNDRGNRAWQLITAQADIAYLYSTSTDVDRNNLIFLDDPQGTQLAQNIVPLTRTGEIPDEAQDIINGVSAQLDADTLKSLEALTQGENPISEKDAANFWLKTKKG
ncbi:MAG: glycine betaine ABC transporter substrate-binding protein [Rothia sp. (in: high G+C Gram-positive bacteria)]|nr:glycine betaine ABC transporter substrate-binding protein [Rothia sp. (in: high G+C Gram-positive bacteria)]